MTISMVIALSAGSALLFWGVAAYNGLVTARNRFANAFAQIDVQLQRRFDLIPNLVDTTGAYLRHERETLEAVIAARSAAQTGLAAAKASPGEHAAMARLATAQERLDTGLGRLLAVAEAYPELKADQNMAQLNEELSSTENRVAFARQAYNDAILAYNNRREVFPTNLLAGAFGFARASALEIPADARSAVRAAPRVTL